VELRTILVVEDDEHLRVLVESILRAHSFQTLAAGSVQTAIALISDPKWRMDLIFTDIGLPPYKLGGLDLAREAVRLRPGVAVLYAAGQVLTDAMRARFIGNSAFLPKPYTAEALLLHVRSLLSKPSTNWRWAI
jgi:DNA-binding response OmpR family regulator